MFYISFVAPDCPSKSSNRIVFLDIAKGIAILCVVIGHNRPIPQFLYQCIYAFHVPLFFIISGYFLKNLPILDQMKKKGKLLLKPLLFGIFSYFLISLCLVLYGWLTNSFLENFGKESIKFLLRQMIHWPDWLGPFWFLEALFWAFLWTTLFLKLSKRIGIICAAVLWFLAYLCAPHFFIPLCFWQGANASLFVYTGAILKGKLQGQTLLYLGATSFVISTFYLCIMGHFEILLLSSLTYSKLPDTLILSFLTSFAILAFAYIISKKFSTLSALLSFWGRNTLIVLCLEGIFYHTVPWNHIALWLAPWTGCEGIVSMTWIAYWNATLILLIKLIIYLGFILIAHRIYFFRWIFSITDAGEITCSREK